MGKFTRLTASLAMTAAAAVALAPAAMAAQPTPSPSLSTVLLAPTGSFTESGNPQADGPMTAADYAGTDNLALAELKRDGYVEGYRRTWLAPDAKRGVVEAVIAFGGHREAQSWLATVKGRSNSQFLVRPLTADGVDSYFGAHYVDKSQPLYEDAGAFIKGNDYFEVSAISNADDLGDLATTQAKREFDAAPAYSVSPNQWPENAKRNSFNFSSAVLPLAIGGGVILVVAIVAALVVVVLLTRQRPGQLAAAGAPASASPTAEGPLMSQDGRYWWDGQAWRDASKEVPPDSLRSADGYYWWDGGKWRPVPPSS